MKTLDMVTVAKRIGCSKGHISKLIKTGCRMRVFYREYDWDAGGP